MHAPAPPFSRQLDLADLVRLRWGLLFGEAALVLSMAVWGLRVPAVPMLGVLGFGVLGNAVARLLGRGRLLTGARVAAVMTLDAFLLTVLLYLGGGPFNPFTTLYLVNVALAAVLLPARLAWTLLAVSVAFFAALFPLHARVPPVGLVLPSHAEMMRLHVGGMWIAFALAAGLILFFVLKLNRALAERESQLANARDLAVRRERLAAMATLAAGTAHELATPLSTILVVLEDLQESLRATPTPQHVAEDLELAISQVERCRKLLRQMSAEAGELAGEAPKRVQVRECLVLALSGVEERERVSLPRKMEEDVHVEAPLQALASAVGGLVRNAVHASAKSGAVVRVEVRRPSATRVAIAVVDEGDGMAPSVLAHAGEPFFSTKPPGEGMGLGLFLARALMEQLGGSLSLDSTPGRGTTACLELPAARAL
ncbi:MAG: ATP-binding protein [Myxococcaceae bacterium]